MRTLIRILSTLALVAVIALPAGVAAADAIHPDVLAPAGTTAVFTTRVANESSQDHTYELACVGLPVGASATFVTSGPIVTSVAIPAHGDTAITLRVVVPADAITGSSAALLVATRNDGVKLEMPFALTVDDAFSLKIVSASKNVSAFSGQEFTLDVTALNSGTRAITNVVPQADMPSKWVLLSEPASVSQLDPGKEAVFHLRVTVPSSQVAIDQPVSVSVIGDQVSSPAADLSVRVQSNPVFLPVAGAMVFIAIAAVAVYFKRKGRR